MPTSPHAIMNQIRKFDRVEVETATPIVEPLKYADISNAVHTIIEANKSDPLISYLLKTPDTTKSIKGRIRLDVYLRIAYGVHKHTVFTIDHGDAIVFYALSRRPKQRLFDRISSAIEKAITKLMISKEQNIRRQEWSEKLDATVKEALGDEFDSMINLTNLATVPEKQGRGYGTALVRHVTAQVPLHLIRYSIARFAHKDSLWQADVQQCSTWLTSSNVANTKFYESCGFLTVAEILLGDNNPMWGKPPIVVPVMVRKPQPIRPPSEN
ncbi:hypothetical protein AcW2_007255 [Taiwanofungus camphoratus]|nr:hypothetical protein AcW2_007255 [Antrodia cinnamomea]